jgi:molecular chaperone HscA
MDDLEADTKDFAARRMDKSIRRAFAGRTIDEIESGKDSAIIMGEHA